MFQAKLSPPQTTGLECFDQLLRFCTAAPMLNSLKRVLFSHSLTSSPLLRWR